MSARGTSPIIALTSGDPAGIGPEITVKSWLKRDAKRVPAFAVIADPAILQNTALRLDLNIPIRTIETVSEAADIFNQALPVLPISFPDPCEPGKTSEKLAPGILESIKQAVALAIRGEASAVVTNPIAKHTLVAAGFPHPGHTEYLGALAATHGHDAQPVMMLAGPDLRVIPVTIHVALAEVPHVLTTQMIVDTARVAAEDLRRWFGIPAPRLALTGLNPHAGENGMMGLEEQTIIKPAIAVLRAEGLAVSGPHPADALFHAKARQAYDVAIAMYHDQALIPLKTLAFDDGVNVTLGLPFIRTSPDHGTAFDIAGTGKARPDSLIASLEFAAQMAHSSRPASAGAV